MGRCTQYRTTPLHPWPSVPWHSRSSMQTSNSPPAPAIPRDEAASSRDGDGKVVAFVVEGRVEHPESFAPSATGEMGSFDAIWVPSLRASA